MKVNIITSTGEYNFENANAVFYSEKHDELHVDVDGEHVFAERMGDIEELEIFANK